MTSVRPKKQLGQHFLKDLTIAERIVSALTLEKENENILEIGPGTGVLSDFLIQEKIPNLILLDIDRESIAYLERKYVGEGCKVLHGDFLKMDTDVLFESKSFSIIGNFPYNISSQIFFKVLDEKEKVGEVVCMIQKEVAERIASKHGSKAYGILSVFLQAYYDIEYLFTVGPEVFNPPPKVNSAVIRLRRNKVVRLDCDEKQFRLVVKEGFQKRRKTLRNALKGLNLSEDITSLEVMNKRAEQLSIQDFVDLTNKIK
ncbi:16S rRNA (adenine(1518)-N(6)/adenine(1519)-N(6))-dimethyltransferase RsmA [Reichenbachiella sp. MALMAid0571]|uniref:16S rRNA (adenine(1518)-N(6)/adenine(1519)-N(6))- dimethyltransferase RsmA n=1 Tax=Reichenbachiella sp. MALMAid0571 TaxID=3143939 RepID=UPI0032DE9AB4